MYRGSPDFPSGRSRQRIDGPSAPRRRDPVLPGKTRWTGLAGAPFWRAGVISSPREFPFLATNRAHECLTKQGNASCQYSVFGSLSVR